MLSRIATIAAMALVLGACTTNRGYWYDFETNRRGDATPELLAQLERARTVCRGEAAKVTASSMRSTITGAIMAERAFDGCMIGQGFELRES